MHTDRLSRTPSAFGNCAAGDQINQEFTIIKQSPAHSVTPSSSSLFVRFWQIDSFLRWMLLLSPCSSSFTHPIPSPPVRALPGLACVSDFSVAHWRLDHSSSSSLVVLLLVPLASRVSRPQFFAFLAAAGRSFLLRAHTIPKSKI